MELLGYSVCVSSSLPDHQIYFLILKTFLREIVLLHPSIVWGRGNEVCLPLRLDQPTFRPPYLVPFSPASHPVPSGTHRSGPLGSRLGSGLPTSVMQLGGGGRRLRMRKWKLNTRATEKSGSQTSVFPQHTLWERDMQAAFAAAFAGAKPTGAKVDCQTKCTLS